MLFPLDRKKLAFIAGVLIGSCLIAGCGGSDSEETTIADLVPQPEVAWEDKGPVILDGCRSGVEYTEAWSCVYGDPGSDRTVVLWGDSHAMQFSPPLIRLAEERGWRLVTMFRGNCLTADVSYKPACDAWRENAMDRIADERPDLVATATDTGNGYALWRGGERLGREESEPILREAFARTLGQLGRATGNRPGSVVVLRDLPRSEFRPPDCLLENPENLAACDFRGFRKNPPGFDLVAARRTPGVRLVDLSATVCPGGICNSARNGMVIYRDTTHISATYAETLTDLIGEQIDGP
ncbi:MAG: hypothetical protein KDB52_06650 [Solirubrobacterales bacterium]|nr:hypothetical protein [Solirubrobacterales bacterium]